MASPVCMRTSGHYHSAGKDATRSHGTFNLHHPNELSHHDSDPNPRPTILAWHMPGRNEGGDGNVCWIPTEVHKRQRKDSILTFFLGFEGKSVYRFFLLFFLVSLFSAKRLSLFGATQYFSFRAAEIDELRFLQSWVQEEFAPETVPQILKGLFYLFQWTIRPPTLTRRGNGGLGQKTAGMLIRGTTPSPERPSPGHFQGPSPSSTGVRQRRKLMLRLFLLTCLMVRILSQGNSILHFLKKYPEYFSPS